MCVWVGYKNVAVSFRVNLLFIIIVVQTNLTLLSFPGSSEGGDGQQRSGEMADRFNLHNNDDYSAAHTQRDI